MPKKKKEEPKKVFDVNDLETIEGIGRVRAEKLRELGIQTPLDLICMSDEELSVYTELDIFACANIIEKVQQTLEKNGVIPNTSDWNKSADYKQKAFHIPTGCKAIDEMLRGGVETQSLTEVYGPDGAGKTQFVLSVTVEALQRGLPVYFIDCENTLEKQRLEEIAHARGYETSEPFWSNLHVNVALDTSRIEKIISGIARTIVNNKIRLIVCDGMVGVTRFEYKEGRGELNPRQNRLKGIIHHLKKAAFYLDTAVLITDQVMGNPDQYPGAPAFKPIGGYIIGHSVKYRIKLDKRTRTKRVATLEKSNRDALQQVEFYLNPAGVSDSETVSKQKELPGEEGLIDKTLLIDTDANTS